MNKKKYLSLREIQKEEEKLLKITVDFFEKNNLNYILEGGTLLGAVRHKGFIPWDDDIDLSMPRPDFDKFIELSKNSNLDVTYSELGNSPFAFAKVINKNIHLETSINCESEYLWIDIFPLDGIENDEKKQLKRVKKIKFIEMMINIKTRKIRIRKNSILKDLLLILLRPFSMIFSPKMIVKIAKEYNYSNSKIAGNIIWGSFPKSIFPKRYYENKITTIFEGNRYKIVKEYDSYLKHMYGDYMKLPPESERETHNFKAYKIL